MRVRSGLKVRGLGSGVCVRAEGRGEAGFAHACGGKVGGWGLAADLEPITGAGAGLPHARCSPSCWSVAGEGRGETGF